MMKLNWLTNGSVHFILSAAAFAIALPTAAAPPNRSTVKQVSTAGRKANSPKARQRPAVKRSNPAPAAAKPPTWEQQSAFVTDVVAAQKALSDAQDQVTAANKAAKDLSDTAAKTDVDSTGVDRIDKFTSDLKTVAKLDDIAAKAAAAPANADTDFTKYFAPVERLKDFGIKNPYPGVTDALKTYATLKVASVKAAADAKSAQAALQKALSAVPDNTKSFLTGLSGKLAKLDAVPAQTLDRTQPQVEVDSLRNTLANGITDLVTVSQLRCALDAKWAAFLAAVKALNSSPAGKPPATGQAAKPAKPAASGASKPAAPPAAPAIDPQALDDSRIFLDGRLKEVLGRLPGWISLLSADAHSRDTKTNQVLQDSLAGPGPENLAAASVHQAEAGATVTVEKKFTADLDMILTGITNLTPTLQDKCFKPLLPTDGFILQLGNGARDLQFIDARINALVGSLNVEYPIDVTRWTSDQISLYYFDDVPRMMQVLNPLAKTMGGSATNQSNADDLRKQLDSDTLDVVNAQQDVSNARFQLQKQQNNLDAAIKTDKADLATKTATSNQTRTKLNAVQRRKTAADADVQTATDNLTTATAARDQAQADLTAAQNAAAANPTDQSLQAKVAAAQRKLNGAQASMDAAQRHLDDVKKTDALAGEDAQTAQQADTDAQNATTAAQTKLSADQDQQGGLAGAVKDAEDKLAAATAALNKTQTAATLTAYQENLAFARARDNTPFWVSLPASLTNPDSDPTKRVILYGFPDSKTIFLRGAQDDVEQVRSMIMKLDRPQAQAMMALWTLEISSQATPDGANRTTEALRQISRELTVSRVEVESSLALLHECINETVFEAFLDYVNAAKNARSMPSSGPAQSAGQGSGAAGGAAQNLIGSSTDSGQAATASGQANAAEQKAQNARVQQLGYSVRDQLGITEPPSQPGGSHDPLPGSAAGNPPKQPAPTHKKLEAILHWNTEGSEHTEDINGIDLAALAFYKADVMKRLGWKSSFMADDVDTPFLRAVVPSPYGTTTLAEALTVLSLAKRQYQTLVMDKFRTALHDRIQADASRAAGIKQNDWGKEYITNPLFPNLALFLGYRKDPKGSAPDMLAVPQSKDENDQQAGSGITGFEHEIVEALVRQGTQQVHEYVLNLIRTQAPRYQRLADQIRNLTLKKPYQSATEQKSTDKEIAEAEAEQTKIKNKYLVPALKWLYGNNTVESADAMADSLLTKPVSETERDLILHKRAASGYSNANAREAALNEMLKKFVKSVGDDLNDQFIEPMFNRLRKHLLQQSVSVGVIQRTSVLASNRLAARVDPSASAALAMGQTQDVLGAAIQLAQIVQTGAVAAQTGGLSTLVQATAPKGGITSILNSLDRLPKDAQEGVYGVTTGNVFQVTPVFDPSGQALRFRFDHVLSTQIREPNDTTDPQLSGIERHSINTEVQLSNYEIRTISQFDTNVKLGLPTHRSGGIPILKDLPVLRDIPLIGWFTRRYGKAAEVQQSLVLGQTTMYPTIGDVIDLLTRPIPNVAADGVE